MSIVETPWAISSTSSGVAAWSLALRSSKANLGLFGMMEVATLLAGDKSWREDLDGRLVDSMSSSEAARSLIARWSGPNLGRMRGGEGKDEK